MKNILLTIIAILIIHYSNGQNTPWSTSGPIGIGTASPSSTLQVAGDARFGINGVYTDLRLFTDATLSGYYQTNSITPLTIPGSGTAKAALHLKNAAATGTTTIDFLVDGRIGIGTTSPANKLDVQGGNASIYNTGNATGFTVGSGATGKTYISLSTSADAGGYGILQSLSATGTTYGNTVINPISGNVGIGTSSPGAKLDIWNLLSGVHAANQQLLAIRDLYNAGGNGQYFQIIGAGNGTNYTNINLISNYGYLSFGARADGSATVTNSLNILSSGNVGIGTISPDQKLTVNGTIHSQAVVVDNNITPDYVFNPDYKLISLKSVKTYIDKNHHLPEIPSAKTIAEQGMNLGEMNTLLLKKVEELTLYLIEKDKKDEDQNKIISKQQGTLKAQKAVNQAEEERIKRLEHQVELLLKKK